MEEFELERVPDCSAVSQLPPAVGADGSGLSSDTLILVSQRDPDQYTDTGYMSKYSTVGDVSRYVSSDFDMIGVRKDISERVKYSDLSAWGDLSVNAIPPKVINGLRIECGIPKDISSYDLSAGMDWDFKHHVFDRVSAFASRVSSLYADGQFVPAEKLSVGDFIVGGYTAGETIAAGGDRISVIEIDNHGRTIKLADSAYQLFTKDKFLKTVKIVPEQQRPEDSLSLLFEWNIADGSSLSTVVPLDSLFNRDRLVVNNLIATNLSSSARSDIGLFGFESATSSVVPASIDGLHDSLYVALAKLEKRIAAIERDGVVLLEDGFELNTAKRPVMKSKAPRTARSTGKTMS